MPDDLLAHPCAECGDLGVPRGRYSSGRPNGLCADCTNKMRRAIAEWRVRQAAKEGKLLF